MTQSERIFLAQLNVLWPVLDPLPASVIAVSWRGRVLFANRAARGLLGPEPERRMIEDAFAAGGVTREQGGRVGAAALGVLRALEGKPVQAEELRLRVRGQRIAVRINAAPIQGPDGRALGVLVLLFDVTELVAAEARSRLLARIGQSLVSPGERAGIAEQVANLVAQGMDSPCAVFLLNDDEGAIGSCHGVFSPPLRTAAERALARQELFRDGETLAVPLVREKRLLGAIAVTGSFSTADGALLNQIATETALALENARLIGEMRAAVEAKDAVLAVASHEITTPLAALSGYAELCARVIEDENPNLPALERAVDGLRRTTDRVLELSRRLLDSERVRSGRLVIEKHTVDLLPVLHEVIERMAIAANRIISFDARAPALVGPFDRVRIEEVLHNLVSNAVRYSPPETPVHVVAEVNGSELRVRVIDRGIGIPENDRPHLFEAFRRGANARSGGPGLGLGLHLAQEIVRSHGGRIWFDTGLGGTTFYVALPLS